MPLQNKCVDPSSSVMLAPEAKHLQALAGLLATLDHKKLNLMPAPATGPSTGKHPVSKAASSDQTDTGSVSLGVAVETGCLGSLQKWVLQTAGSQLLQLSAGQALKPVCVPFFRY